ncbi:hypothetical protein NV379_01810 [Paenibacillus sp. N1-5-1-14]|uniref:hypothetical protein n=1 Tax=Paenibacillus radicibacter TaxID=2972488 RepID=UPI002158AC52|nr:hypothetical protein [Paenibacillus radicibacter]MCR8641381.1 hypothetical protein [Paenibacillus radicibacter]
MKNVIFDVSKEYLGRLAEAIVDNNPDSMIVVAPLSGTMSVHAPTKKGKSKGYHRMKFEVRIPEDAIKGEDALGDFGAFTLIRLPKSRVQDHLIRE